MKSLVESLFDRDLIEKNIKFGDIYELECVYMQSRFAFTALYTKSLIRRYSKYSSRGGLNKYWVYYGDNPEWKKGIPQDIEQICNVFIGIIDNFNMEEVENIVDNKFAIGSVFVGSNDPLANALRNKLRSILLKYTKGNNSHNVYVDTNYKYHGHECVHIKLGKNNYKQRIPDYLELIFKKK